MALSEVLDGAKNLFVNNLHLLLSKFVIPTANIVVLLRHVVIIRTCILLVFNLIKHFLEVALRSLPLWFWLCNQHIDHTWLIRILILSDGYPFRFPFLSFLFKFILLFF